MVMDKIIDFKIEFPPTLAFVKGDTLYYIVFLNVSPKQDISTSKLEPSLQSILLKVVFTQCRKEKGNQWNKNSNHIKLSLYGMCQEHIEKGYLI